MKKTTKMLFNIIAIVAVIGFGIIGCDNGTGGGNDPVTYPVTVNGGNGSGSYAAGVTVSISATAQSGQTFTNWTVNSGGATLANPNSASTTFTMPVNAVTVTANFTGGGGNNDNTSNTNPDVGTGTIESRKYRMEVYNISSSTSTYLINTYAGKTLQDVTRADVVSRGHTAANTYT
ncbi:InlB B-repeat-containing protein, partial [Treponema sp. R8-4-B8]